MQMRETSLNAVQHLDLLALNYLKFLSTGKITQAKEPLMYLTFAETCARLCLSHETVRKLIKSGALRAHKSGAARNSHYRISEDAIADYLREYTVKARR